MGSNPNLGLVNGNACMEFGLIILSLRGNEILISIKGQNSATNVRIIMCNNPNQDLVKFIAYRNG